MGRRFEFTIPLGLSLAGILLLVAFMVVTLPGIMGAVFTRGIDEIDLEASARRMQHGHEDAVEQYIARTNGRSLFYPPIPPPPPPKPKVVATEPEPVEVPDEPEVTPPPIVEKIPPTPPVPPRYTGPPPRAITVDTVWFPDEVIAGIGGVDTVLQIREGEEKQGIEVVEIIDATMVRLKHRGGDYRVSIFDEDDGANAPFDDPIVEPGPTPGIISVKSDGTLDAVSPPVERNPETGEIISPVVRKNEGAGVRSTSEIPRGATSVRTPDGRTVNVARSPNISDRERELREERREASRENSDDDESRESRRRNGREPNERPRSSRENRDADRPRS